ncbi:alpha/beta hydrolase [Spiroplasma endosymbiont of Labia minor]|uniref:alpha/beta hydrolase n=1 Tax=Spiroplasma endosymbiont of Labia minor TaxID=3066305 RepID=UPI0030D283E7
MINVIVKMMIKQFQKHFTTSIKIADNSFLAVNWIQTFNEMINFQTGHNKISVPEDLVLENVTFKTSDNLNLVGIIYVANQNVKKWIITTHGYSSSKLPAFYHAYFLAELGYNILAFDFRNHGDSDGLITSFGFSEVNDLISASEFLISQYNAIEINYIGSSMGAFTINYLNATSFELLKNYNTKWIISDSSYNSAISVIENLILNRFSKINTTLLETIMNEIISVFKNDYNVDLFKLNFTNEYKNKSVPTLFIHAKDDAVVSFQDCVNMYEHKEKIDQLNINEIKLFEQAGHVRSQIVHYDEFVLCVKNFISKYNN